MRALLRNRRADRSASTSPMPRRAAICDEDVAICRAIGEHGLPLIRQIAARKRPGEPVNILTHCNAGWLATVDWGTAHGADLPGPRGAASRACLGRRDPAAQPGRRAHRLGARQPWRAAHGDRRQCRRPPDAARPGRSVHRRHRPHHRAAATSPTRSAPTSRRWPPRTTACRSTWPCRRPRSTGPCATGWPTSRSSSAAPTRSPIMRGRTADGTDRSRARSRPTARPPQLRLRRHPGPPGHRPDHRARRVRGQRGRADGAVPRPGRALTFRQLLRGRPGWWMAHRKCIAWRSNAIFSMGTGFIAWA